MLSVIAGLLVLSGVPLVVVGWLGRRRRLPRNRFAGVRTPATMRDQETFAVGNQVGAPFCLAAAVVALLGGSGALFAPSAVSGWPLVVIGGIGVIALTVTAGLLGDRAAARVPEPERFTGCGGSCACCDLAARNACAGQADTL